MRSLTSRLGRKSPRRSAPSSLYIAFVLLFSAFAFGQGSTVSGHPVITNGVGQPVPGATVAICSSNPGVLPTTPCTNPAPTFTDITDTVSCSGTNKPLNSMSAPSVGANCSNPGFTDGRGNVVVFAPAGTYFCEYYGRGIIGIYVVPCIFPGTGSGGGGGSGPTLQVNGTPNLVQSLLNLTNSVGVNPVDNGGGSVSFNLQEDSGSFINGCLLEGGGSAANLDLSCIPGASYQPAQNAIQTSIVTPQGGAYRWQGSISGAGLITAQPNANSPALQWPTGNGTLADAATLPIVLDPVTGIISCPTCGAGGGGSVNPAAQYSTPYYTGPGIASLISGSTPPSINGQYYTMYTVNAGVPVPPVPTQVGLSSRAVTGTTSTDTILYSDNASNVDYQTSVSVATSMNTATGFGNSQFVTVLNNNTTGSNTTVTVTPITWQVNGASTLVIQQGQSCKFKVDAAGGKWDAICSDAQLVAGANITLARTPYGGVTIAATGGGGSGAWSALTNPTGNLTLNMSTFASEFDWTLPNIATGAMLFKGNDSTGVDTSPILTADTVAGSHQNPFSVSITGVKQFQSCWAPGPNGFINIGSVLACTAVNTSPLPKLFVSSSVATHNLAEFWQSNSAYTGDFWRVNTATATSGCNFNLFTLYNGVTSTDGSNGGGSLVSSLHCNGLFTGSANLTALTLPSSGIIECLHKSAVGVVTGTGADCGAGGGSGTINAALQYAAAYYSGAGSATTISGLVAPTAPSGVPQVAVSIPSGGAAVAPVMLLPGLAGRAITGTTSTDTVLATDCNPKRVEYVGSVAVAIALPTATSLAVTNCTFRVTNNTTGSTTALTITPATWTINGAATLVIAQGQIATIFVDPNSATNWAADVHEQAITAGANISLTRTPTSVAIVGQPGTVTSIGTSAPLAGGTITGTGTITCSPCVINNGANTGSSAMTLDMSAATGANALKMPSGAGLTSNGTSSIAYDTTAKNTHMPTNGADSLSAAEATAIAANAIPKSTSSTIALLAASTLLDDGTKVSTTEPFVSSTYDTCPDTSASGTAQVCNTTPTFTVVTGSCVTYTTTTANSGAGLTLNVNSLGAKSVAKWQGTTTLAANDVLANKEVHACYDGTNWELATIGNAPSGSGLPSAAINTVIVGPTDVPGAGSATASAVASPTPLYFTDPRAWIYLMDDFMNVPGTGISQWTAAGTGGTAAWVANQTGTAFGVFSCTTLASASDACYVTLNANSTGFNGSFNGFTKGDIIYRVKLSQTTNTNFFAGLIDINTQHGEGSPNVIGIGYNVGKSDTGWECVLGSGSTYTRTSTAGTLDTNWHDLRIRFTSAAHISCSVDGGAETAITTNFPTSTNMTPTISIDNNATANIVTYQGDYMFMAIGAAR